jgi:NitT/TauT family transport system permease protein
VHSATYWGEKLSWLERWKKLYLPSIFPALVTGWVTAAGGAWNASIVSEYVQFRGSLVETDGLGSLISKATAAGNYRLLAGCLLAMVATVVFFNRTLWNYLYQLASTKYRFET